MEILEVQLHKNEKIVKLYPVWCSQSNTNSGIWETDASKVMDTAVKH